MVEVVVVIEVGILIIGTEKVVTEVGSIIIGTEKDPEGSRHVRERTVGRWTVSTTRT